MKMTMRSAAGFVAIASVGLVSSTQAARTTTPVQVQDDGAHTNFVPRSVDTTLKPMVVVLSGDSVATAQRKAGRKLTDAERNAIIAARRADQAALLPTLQQQGARVLARFQGALNGIKVNVALRDIAKLRKVPGVLDVLPVGTYSRNNTVAVPYIGAPAVWQLPPQYQGQGVKIAIIDTGIDYTHANFGGPGTAAAYTAAHAASTSPADPALFGPGAPKVKGGIDLVGDDYTGSNNPVPDPNPLDCGGHGSHVAGTAAGFGVTSSGQTYTGPYNAAAYTPGAFRIGPGVAPKADLYAVRVFGCSGQTNVVSDAIEWAVSNGMDVISMSLGSNYGSAVNSESASIANASAAGILVVAASGNAGPTPYITSAPASSEGAIAVAATDATSVYPGGNMMLSNGKTIKVQDSNGASFADGTSYPIVVLRNPDGSVSFGCNEAEYDKTRNGGIDITGKLVVAVRGSSCGRVFRAGAGQHFGAAAVALINNAAGYPPVEGAIGHGDTTTNPYEPVTIPFFGVLSSDTASLAPLPAPATASVSNTLLANPGFGIVASFSSAGPRIGDSALRPGITAPGVAVVSTLVGSGNGATTMSGTSMATPAVAGTAALVRQAKPGWSVADVRSAILQTGAPTKMSDYSPRNEGSGLVQALGAVNTQAVVRTPNDSISFGYFDLLQDLSSTRTVTVHNYDAKAVQFNISVTRASGPASAVVSAPPSVVVPGGGDAIFNVTLNMPATAVGVTHTASGACCKFDDVGGYLRLTPSNSRLNGNVSLTVPYYLVAHSRSNLSVSSTPSSGAVNMTVSNAGGVQSGEPDLYSVGLYQPMPQNVTQADTRAVGVQSWPSGGDSTLVFAVNTYNRISQPNGGLEWDIYIDPTGAQTNPANAKYILIVTNSSYLSSTLLERFVVARYTIATGAISLLNYVDAATDNSTLLIPVLASSLDVTPGNPRFHYWENHFGPDGTSSSMPGMGQFNAFTPSLTFAESGPVLPNGSGTASATVTAEWASTPALGVMVVAQDNVAGAQQAMLVPVSPASK